MHVDATGLYVFNNGFMGALEVITKGQRLLKAWHEALISTVEDLKLTKCY